MITPITFDYAGPTAADHGALFDLLLDNGIVRGCTLNYSGTVLTVAAGHLNIAGRLMRLSAAETITISATSGYARVLVQIDLSHTTTVTVNGLDVEVVQPTFVVQTAETTGGFASLTQEEINSGGTVYQAVLCVVSCGTSGISGIVSSLGAAVQAVTPASIGAASLDANGKVTAAQASAVPMDVTGTAYTLALSDAGKWIRTRSSSATVVTIPTNASVAFPTGTEITVCRDGSGTATIYPASGVTLFAVGGKSNINKQYEAVLLKKVESDLWSLQGDLS